ncbi:hypothetical protein A1O1_05471 [Capronia coronata CBS 617.96]|uniref:Enoyl reductase (ER) domain-containing protein n=1 Tax=Capronia coronata CBS 617.96 TaxID=1182541 RepID=W9YH03_9EURO|nr:uncharacterized protein A1O1_05471 [Capronia coronata CBS 617.96]EXJ88541.1 hypothetical protein A1O1_05471 [Capronia coronata CBS 617.96]
MRAITVTSWGAAPVFTANHPEPSSSDADFVTVKVVAAGLHQLVRAQAAGTHYSTKGAKLPYIPGADGVGTLPDGQMVYFSSTHSGGAFAEYVRVPRSVVTPLSSMLDGADVDVDPVKIAGLLNPGMSSWMALAARVDRAQLPPAFRVVIVGVTSLSGKIAVHFMRQLGAGKVVGVARNAAEMAALDLDQRIVLAESGAGAADTDFSALGDVDVILDYLYGPPALALLTALASKVPTQYCQIGSLAGADVSLPAQLLRSKNLTLRGAGFGSWSMAHYAQELPALLTAVAKLPPQDIKVRKLEEVDAAWAAKRERTVFVP